MSITKRVVTLIERVEIVGDMADRQSTLMEMDRDGWNVKAIGPYTDRRLFPSVDCTRFKLVAERLLDEQ
jgi:hypothetical protein